MWDGDAPSLPSRNLHCRNWIWPRAWRPNPANSCYGNRLWYNEVGLAGRGDRTPRRGVPTNSWHKPAFANCTNWKRTLTAIGPCATKPHRNTVRPFSDGASMTIGKPLDSKGRVTRVPIPQIRDSQSSSLRLSYRRLPGKCGRGLIGGGAGIFGGAVGGFGQCCSANSATFLANSSADRAAGATF